jgi:hypothetical protein
VVVVAASEGALVIVEVSGEIVVHQGTFFRTCGFNGQFFSDTSSSRNSFQGGPGPGPGMNNGFGPPPSQGGYGGPGPNAYGGPPGGGGGFGGGMKREYEGGSDSDAKRRRY